MAVDLEERIRGVLRASPDVVGGYLFGSRATGDAREGSDIDVAVLFEPPASLDRVVELEDEIERAVGMAVDLVDLGRSDAFLALDAIRGERIFERDGLRLDLFDLYVLRRAGDLAPHERARRRQLLGLDGT